MKSLRMPRLLPVTIFVMALALGARCAGLAGAATQPAAEPPAHSAAPAPAPPARAAIPMTAPAPPAVPMKPVANEQEAQKLRRRRADLDAEQAALRTRQSVIAAAEQKLEQRVAELKALQAELEKDQAARVDATDRHWDSLVQLYERMKPRDAARILEGMDTQVVVALIARMKELRAAPILAAMRPDRARDVTAGLAERHAPGAAADSANTKGG